MTIPTQVRSYNYSLNNRITYTSLNDLVASVGYGTKNFLIATCGLTLKYTCDGTTGPTSGSDHTDRLASKANFTTRGAASGNAQSFWVITDANGADWMMAYQGATDDIARISYSPGGLYTPAGTANQQPTATDEVVVQSANSIVGSTTSADRVWHAICSTDKKAFRFFIARSNVCVGTAFSIESCNSTISGAGNSYSPAMLGTFATTFAPATYFAGATAGKDRPSFSSVAVTCNLVQGFESPPSSTGSYLDGVNPEAQGSAGSLMFPLSTWSTTAGGQGKHANLIDWYKDGNSKSDGDLTTDKFWVHLTFSGSASAGVLWPWDGTTAIQMS